MTRWDEPEPVVIRSPEHASLRVGRVTGSVIRIIMRGTMTARNNLLKRMDTPTKFYTLEDSPNMPPALQWGHIYEPWIRAEFWARHPEYEVDRPAFIHPHDGRYGTREEGLPWPILEHTGTSPDAVLLAGDDLRLIGGLECKNPYDERVVEACVRKGHWRDKFIDQCDLNMLVSGAPAWWLLIGNPREPDSSSLRYFEVCIPRDEERLDVMRRKICEFIEMWKMGETFQPLTAKERLAKLDDLI